MLDLSVGVVEQRLFIEISGNTYYKKLQSPYKKQHPVPANSVIQGAVKLCSAFVGLCVAVLKRLKQIAELIGGTSVCFLESVNIAVSRFHL